MIRKPNDFHNYVRVHIHFEIEPVRWNVALTWQGMMKERVAAIMLMILYLCECGDIDSGTFEYAVSMVRMVNVIE